MHYKDQLNTEVQFGMYAGRTLVQLSLRPSEEWCIKDFCRMFEIKARDLNRAGYTPRKLICYPEV